LKPTWKYAGPLVDAILAGTDKWFGAFLDCIDLIIASVTLPQFKLHWLDNTGKEWARSMLYSYMSALHDGSPNTGSYGNVGQEDGFCFGTCGADKRGANAVADIYLSNLTDTSNELWILAKFPVILKVFLKHNTNLPSSAQLGSLLDVEAKFIFQGAID
jgi:hypothetical protein